jgi:hypothetical protein
MIKQKLTAWVILAAFLMAGASGVRAWCLGGDGHVEMGDVTCCLESLNVLESKCCVVADNAPADDGCEKCLHVPVFSVGPISSFSRAQHPSLSVQEPAIAAFVSCATSAKNVRLGDFSHYLSFASSTGPASLRTVILLI